MATALLVLTGAATIFDWPVVRADPVLYAVGLGTYLLVLILALLLRSGTSAVVVGVIHLVTALLTGLTVVQATGGVQSGLSFLYLLAILDAAIIGGRRAALLMATLCVGAYAGQLAAQIYHVPLFVGSVETPVSTHLTAVVVHGSAFLLAGLLSGHLAELLTRARAVASSAQQDLERAEAMHAEVLASLPVGVLTYNRERLILTANESAARILGAPLQGLVGLSVPDALSALPFGLSHPTEVSLEVRGKPRVLSVSKSAVLPGSDVETPNYEVLVLEDRTQVRSLQTELSRKERLAALGELSAAIAHEIRNPLASISGAVELLTGEQRTADTQTRLQAIVLREIDRLNQLVSDFLLYARPQEPQVAPFDVAEVLTDLRDVATKDPAWHGHTIVVDVPVPLHARADARQVRQLLWNLLHNALEASRPGKPVTVRARSHDRALVLEVIDEGEGIDPAIRPHLFEPFRTTKRTGTGLGLAVVHRIVEAHGGAISVTSERGLGTTMHVSLPAPQITNGAFARAP